MSPSRRLLPPAGGTQVLDGPTSSTFKLADYALSTASTALRSAGPPLYTLTLDPVQQTLAVVSVDGAVHHTRALSSLLMVTPLAGDADAVHRPLQRLQTRRPLPLHLHQRGPPPLLPPLPPSSTRSAPRAPPPPPPSSPSSTTAASTRRVNCAGRRYTSPCGPSSCCCTAARSSAMTTSTAPSTCRAASSAPPAAPKRCRTAASCWSRGRGR